MGCPAWTIPRTLALKEWVLAPPGPLVGKAGLCLGPQSCANTGQLYFGAGSKLTVLGK